MCRFIVIYLISLLTISCAQIIAGQEKPKPNILLILTDDQDVTLNGMFPMRNVQRLLADKGATFVNAFTSSPLCCPSRASILTGLYAHNHGTRNNSLNGGCNSPQWRNKFEPKAMPVKLQKANYRTFFAGKYLNQYAGESVPAGWHEFYGLHGNSRYYNYTLRENERNVSYASDYLTDLLRDKALKFLKAQKHGGTPFFAMISPPAPHAPYTPADRHVGAFAGVRALRTPNFNVLPASTEKHWLMSFSSRLTPQMLNKIDKYFQQRWEALLAVDELVAALVAQLQEQQQLDNTFIIYASDNGYHMGQFGQPFDKRQPYETDVRIPLIVRGPGVAAGVKVTAPVLLLDLLPTMLEWAQLPQAHELDGLSFGAYVYNAPGYDALSDNYYHRSLLVEHWGEGNGDTYNKACPWPRRDRLAQCTLDADCHCQDAWNNTYACVRHFGHNLDRLYCEFEDREHFVEIYDVNEDPHQMANIVNDLLAIERALYSLALNNLTHCAGANCADIAI